IVLNAAQPVSPIYGGFRQVVQYRFHRYLRPEQNHCVYTNRQSPTPSSCLVRFRDRRSWAVSHPVAPQGHQMTSSECGGRAVLIDESEDRRHDSTARCSNHLTTASIAE